MAGTPRILIVFCLMLMICFSFSYSFFRAYIKSQKAEFRKELSISNPAVIQTLELKTENLYKNANGIEWEDQNKEVVLNGKYYDIISIDIENELTTIKLICDEKESSLFDNFFAKHKEGKGFLISFLKLFHCIDDTSIVKSITPGFNFTNTNFFANILFQLNDYQFSLIKPPCLT